MDGLVFASSWRSPIEQAKLQVKVELQEANINPQIMYAAASRHKLTAPILLQNTGTISEAESGSLIIGK